MKFQKRQDIKEQTDALQAILNLQEQGKKLFAQSIKENACRNRGILSLLRGDVRDGMHELHLAMKYDQVTIKRACRERRYLKIAMAEYTMEQARESLSRYVFDRMNLHNALLYEVRQRGKLLENMQLRLQNLIDLETANPDAKVQLQIIRQLENNIEKMHMKIMSAEKIYQLYLKMVDLLRDELCLLPLILDDLQRMVEAYHVELRGMHLINMDMAEAMEAAKADMVGTEAKLIAEKKFRDNSLSIQKKQIERIRTKDASERHRKMPHGPPSLLSKHGEI
uniref:Uncharacterized protein n=1 Tax=Salvator merianae TaxID=96440 RepID=A0A8D0DFH0_SALMN